MNIQLFIDNMEMLQADVKETTPADRQGPVSFWTPKATQVSIAQGKRDRLCFSGYSGRPRLCAASERGRKGNRWAGDDDGFDNHERRETKAWVSNRY